MTVVGASAQDDQLDIDASGVLHVPGDLGAYVSRLEEQYTKALQKIDPHTYDYVHRLEDEALFLELAVGTQAYYERQGITRRRREWPCFEWNIRTTSMTGLQMH